MNRQWLFRQHPAAGIPYQQCFEQARVPVPDVGPGQFLVANRCFSIEPAMVPWMLSVTDYMVPQLVGAPMLSWATAEVVASRHPDFAKGDRVSGTFGWQDYCLSNGLDINGDIVARVPAGASDEAAMSALWISGLTAFIGLYEVGKPVPGDTVLVSGAAGSVGNLVGQLAKLAGCKVVGIAGSDEKCQWLQQTLGFDASVNYKTQDVPAAIAAHCPDGVDIYWDNVGGDMLNAATGALATGGRVVLCGFISIYEDFSNIPSLHNWLAIAGNRGSMTGFNVTFHKDKYAAATTRLKRLLDEGQLHLAIDALKGFDQLPEALNRIYQGKNIGKQLVHNDLQR